MNDFDIPYGLPVPQTLSSIALAALAHRLLPAAISWLEVAVKGDPEPVADFRTWTASLVEVLDRLDTPETVVLDARELMRRAERGLGQAIREGQAAGRIRSPGSRGDRLPGPTDIAKFVGSTQITHLYRLSDVSQGRFEAALAEARRTGYLSQEGMRKLLETKDNSATYRARRIADLAARSYTTRQIAADLGTRGDVVRRIAAEHGIEITADSVVGSKVPRLDPEAVVRESVAAIEGLAIGLRLLDEEAYRSLDPVHARQWLHSLEAALPTIFTLKKELHRVHPD